MSDSPRGVALITGAARRIGRAIALDLAARGYGIAVHYNGSGDEAKALAAEIISAGGAAATFQADLARAEQATGLLPAVAAGLGPVSVLINNASLFEMDTVRTATVESWDRHLDINLRAPFFLAQSFAEQLPAGMDGNIVNLIDMRVWKLTPFFASYTVSKSGLWTLTRTLAMALAPRIRVNGIGPGPSLLNIRQSADQFARQVAGTPLKRGAPPDEIARAVRFILDTPSMTGQMIALDGGQHLPAPSLADSLEPEE